MHSPRPGTGDLLIPDDSSAIKVTPAERASWQRKATADAIRSFDSLNLGGHPDVRIRSGDMTLRPTSDIARAGRAGVAVLQARSGRACSEGVRVRRYRGAG